MGIGPGVGLATRQLVQAGTSVTAVEPAPALAAHLRSRLPQVRIIEAAFEDAPLAEASFDLALAAMSFDWVDETLGLPKLGKVLVPGGWTALWWTLWGEPARPDRLGQAAAALHGQSASAANKPGRPQYELDADARFADLRERAQLEQVSHEAIPWTIEMDAAQVRAHYASMIAIRRRAPDEQRKLLDALKALVRDRFGGKAERHFLTVLYAGRRPRGSEA